MAITFTKMHSLGNDFMVVNTIGQAINWQPQTIRLLGCRNTGVGFDQCLLLAPPNAQNVDFFYRIFNADGQEVGQCANGARALARFIIYYGLSRKKIINIATLTTKMQLHLHSDTSVTIEMEPPKLHPQEIPIKFPQITRTYQLKIGQQDCAVHAINVGNPHAVLVVKDLNNIPLTTLGKQISENYAFPLQANVNFMQIDDWQNVRLRVYERGCGETKACGSGAVASAAIGRLYHQLATPVSVHLPGGKLMVDWPNLSGPIYLTGTATFVYEGKLMLIP